MAQDQKREAIIEAAIKRFAHFGVAKTTMAEIAADLSFSKASLYYYFPDKLNLYAEVLDTIAKSGTQSYEEEMTRENDPFKAIQNFLQLRTDFIIRYHNILEYARSFNRSNLPAELQPVFAHFKKIELQRIIAILEKGIQSGVFKIKDSKKKAELFFDFMEAFRIVHLSQTASLMPDKKDFQAILKREQEFALVFFNGLTNKNS